MVSSILAGMTVALVAAACMHQQKRSSCWRIFLLGATAVACNVAVTWLGAATHSGYGFWQRLTVHEPADAGVGMKTEAPPSSVASWASSWMDLSKQEYPLLMAVPHLCSIVLLVVVLGAFLLRKDEKRMPLER